MKEDLLKSLDDSFEKFTVPLRMDEGFNVECFANLCDVLKECTKAWHEEEDIPKSAAVQFVDIHSAMIACSYLYDEKVREQIELAADEIMDLIRTCLQS